VVAAEIRKLAENVVKSTGSIEEIAREIQTAANGSVMAAEENVKMVKAGVGKVDPRGESHAGNRINGGTDH
jgi:methyl-accepting chemotaxis protein